MGLDTTHGCWHGSYSSFSEFRRHVADAAEKHYGYTPSYVDHPLRAYMGWWDNYSSTVEPTDHRYADVLDVFFVHSDCEGYIFPTEAGLLAGRLDALVGYLDDDGPLRNWTPQALLRQFIVGLRKADDEWEVIGFH